MRRLIKLSKPSASLLALVFCAGCTSLRSTSSPRLDQQVAQADAAYRRLNCDHAAAYNNAVATVARQLDGRTADQSHTELDSIGVKIDDPDIKLPLARYHVAPAARTSNELTAVGVPMLLDYDTTNAPLYPREGLLVSATAVYRRVHNEPHLSLVTGKNRIELNGSTFPLKIDNVAPIAGMTRRGKHVARAGFSNMLHPADMRVKTGIFLTEPYDPNKIPILMVHGLQSTPFAFVRLIDAIRRDPTLNQRFQVWTFLYATGTPVLFNALELRQQLEKTLSVVDPYDHDFSTRRIVVLGHSMGGLIGHTLVSSNGERMFERYGFRVMNRAEITKYKAFYPESVYLSTVIKNLETAEPLTVDVRSRL